MLVKDRINKDFLYYFDQGEQLEAYKVFGAHLVKDENGKNIACEFCVYAPNAARVEIVGEWNNFNTECQELYCVDEKGVWYAYLEGDYEWQRYKYLIHTKQGERLYKSDPYGFYSQLRPCQDSKVADIEGYEWSDGDWMMNHPKTYDQPLLIYEMHLGSWRRKNNSEDGYLSFREIAPQLIEYLKQFGYTHVELMPVYEHPLDMSWGYQGVGYYSITPRYGAPKDFMWFVDELHKAGYGVILDWVPGHICRDGHGLYRFDGTYLFEYGDEFARENVEWGTANLDLGKGTTRSFLYSNALFFMNYYHVDGFRVDAVSNLIYYHGNPTNGTNEGATSFLAKLSTILFGKDDRVILSAEDSSSHPNVTKPAGIGLGFNYKWDMGWMNDTLKYFKLDPVYRKYHHHQLTFSMVYNYNEHFILPLSHDEIVHMKGSLLNKMPGDEWQKFANYRLLISYMMTHPGKKLLFMGNELASYDEWHYEKDLPWNILEYPNHDSANRFVKDLTNLYKKEPSLWQCDLEPKGFLWLAADNCDQSLYIYKRIAKDPKDHLIVVMNCTPNVYHDYRVGCEDALSYTEVFNSDMDYYNGSNQINPYPLKVTKIAWQNHLNSFEMTVPPLGVAIFKPNWPVEEKKVATKKAPAKKSTTTKKTTDAKKTTKKTTKTA